jgi:hypothetical protein
MTIAYVAHAKDIEPRAYSHAPVGLNFLVVGYGYTRGGLSFDTALPITNVSLTTKSALLTYTRALGLWGKSGKIDFLTRTHVVGFGGLRSGVGAHCERFWRSLFSGVDQFLWSTCTDVERVSGLQAELDHRRKPAVVGARGSI